MKLVKMVIVTRQGYTKIFLLCCLVLIMLIGCTRRSDVLHLSNGNQNFQRCHAHQVVLASILHWKLQGKIAISSGDDDGRLAKFTLIYTPNRQDIQFFGPLGTGWIKLHVEKKHAILQDSKGTTINGLNVDDVLYQRLGWKIPFNKFLIWLKGMSSSTSNNIKCKNSLLHSLDDGIWKVTYHNYQITNGFILPKKMTITGRHEPIKRNNHYDDQDYTFKDFKLKLMLKKWWILIKSQ